jgi:hypothetical protein
MLGAFAVLTTSSALGYVAEATPQVSGAIMLTLLLLLLPFGLGAMVGRRWIVLFVFVTVLATALLPDRTVVHLSASGLLLGWLGVVALAIALLVRAANRR